MFKSVLLVFVVACDAGDPPAKTSAPTPPAAKAPPPAAPAAADNAPASANGDSAAAANAEDGGGAASAEEGTVEGHAGLAKADSADGTEDRIVKKCAGCALAMDGDAAHTIEAHGYTLHMCSATCKTHYEADLEGNLAKLAE